MPSLRVVRVQSFLRQGVKDRNKSRCFLPASEKYRLRFYSTQMGSMNWCVRKIIDTHKSSTALKPPLSWPRPVRADLTSFIRQVVWLPFDIRSLCNIFFSLKGKRCFNPSESRCDTRELYITIPGGAKVPNRRNVACRGYREVSPRKRGSRGVGSVGQAVREGKAVARCDWHRFVCNLRVPHHYGDERLAKLAEVDRCG